MRKDERLEKGRKVRFTAGQRCASFEIRPGDTGEIMADCGEFWLVYCDGERRPWLCGENEIEAA